MIRVFRALDQFSSVSGAKIMAKKSQIVYKILGDFPN